MLLVELVFIRYSYRTMFGSQAMTAKAGELAGRLKGLLSGFRASGLWESWSTHSTLSSFVEECSNLSLLVSIAAEADVPNLSSEEAENLKSARTALLAKRATFLESLTLFPLGQFVQQASNFALESHQRDLGFLTELDLCVQAVAELKTFTPEVLFKGDDIQVPNFTRVVDAQMKSSLIQQACTSHFKEAQASKLALLESKFKELAVAIRGACIAKFQKVLGEDLRLGFKLLSEGHLTVEGQANMVEVLTKSKTFAPMTMTTVQKCLGQAAAKEIIDLIIYGRSFLTMFVAVFPTVLALIQTEKDGATDAKDQLGSGRLLQADMIKFMKSFGDEEVQKSLQEMDQGLWLHIVATMDRLCKAAMSLVQV